MANIALFDMAAKIGQNVFKRFIIDRIVGIGHAAKHPQGPVGPVHLIKIDIVGL